MSASRTRLPEETVQAILGLVLDRLDEVWELADDYFYYVTVDQLELVTGPDDLSEIEELVSAARYQCLERGGGLTPWEVDAYRDRWLRLALTEVTDSDRVPGVAIARVDDGAGHAGVVTVFRQGYSFSNLNTWFGHVYADREEALYDLESHGWCG